MGPRHPAWKNTSACLVMRPAKSGFNGATPPGVEKPCPALYLASTLVELQWGHATRRGKTLTLDHKYKTPLLLQWGHATRRGKTDTTPTGAESGSWLQWGHATRRGKTR